MKISTISVAVVQTSKATSTYVIFIDALSAPLVCDMMNGRRSVRLISLSVITTLNPVYVRDTPT